MKNDWPDKLISVYTLSKNYLVVNLSVHLM